MIKQIPFHNDTDGYKHVANKTIGPGETRMIDAALHPDYEAEAPADVESGPVSLSELIALPIKEIKKQFPALSPDDLTALLTAELAGKNRDSLVKDINAEIIKRGAAELDKTDLDSFVLSLREKSIEELGELAVVHSNDADLAGAIESEINDRNAALNDFRISLPDYDIDSLNALRDQYADQPAYLSAIDEEIRIQDAVD